MTAQEMHIEIDLELQKLNSQVTKNISPEEKDWFLNNEVINYLKSKVNPDSNLKKIGFQDTAKRVEDIKDLIRVQPQPVKVNNRGKAYVSLPSNYFNYIRFDSHSYRDCPANSNIKSTTALEYRVEIKVLLTDAKGYKIELTTPSGVVEIFNITSLPDGYLNIAQGSKQNFMLIKALKILLPQQLKSLISPSTQLYWENESYSYKDLTFIIISDVAIVNSIVTTTTEAPIEGEDDVLNVVTVASTNYTITVFDTQNLPLKAKFRVIDEEFLPEVENSHLSKSRANSPTSSVLEGCMELSKCDGAIIGLVDIVYICQPTLIDISLNSNLNVRDYVAKEIVSNTVRVIKALIGDGTYQAYAQEKVLIE